VSITAGWICYGQRFRKRRLWRIWVLIPLIFVLVTNKINLYVSMSFWFHSPYVGTTFVPIDETLNTFFHVSPFKIQFVTKFYQIFVVNKIFLAFLLMFASVTLTKNIYYTLCPIVTKQSGTGKDTMLLTLTVVGQWTHGLPKLDHHRKTIWFPYQYIRMCIITEEYVVFFTMRQLHTCAISISVTCQRILRHIHVCILARVYVSVVKSCTAHWPP
jgi:hypothetical protein